MGIADNTYHDAHYFYHLGESFPHNHDVVCSCLHQHLTDRLEDPRNAFRPSELVVLLDNTASQNKNDFILCYLASLVENGWFERVTVMYLLKGHTHGAVDQLFSSPTKRLARHNILSPHDVPNFFHMAWERREAL